ncbi:MAG: enterotoxin [Pirellulales bacterium]|nr:enterotoxin [Pirellulales bacterium]
MFARFAFALTTILAAVSAAQAIDLPATQPGRAAATLDGSQLVMENAVLRARWDLSPGNRRFVEVVDRAAEVQLRCDSELFRVTLADGSELVAAALSPVGKATLDRIAPRPGAVRLAERSAGWRAALELATADGRTRFRWQAVLRDDSNYVRQEVAMLAHGGSRPVEFCLLDLPASDARPCGIVDGSPLVSGNFFLACEHPLAKNQVAGGRAACRLPLYESASAGLPKASAAVGIAPAGQLRRGFLYYLDRERARPYRPFTYYISWFDIAAPGLKMDQAQCLEVIEAFGNELAVKRGVKLDAFVFDDGWDDNQSLWEFHAGFPRGFTPLREAAARYNAVLGTWISPFGGYGRHKKERLEFGRSQGYETNRSGFALSGPKYFETFRKVCEDMIRQYGIGYMKFDGMGGGSDDGPGKDYGGDMQALVHLFDRLRQIRPDLFINATTGTWPSPYWLFHSDTVWRGGEDVGYRGEGSKRQQWITYRDGLGYGVRTRRGPLYPFNSLKFQSVMCARLSLAAELGTDLRDLVDDIHMAAASGTQLQEFFVTAAMMTPAAWDAAAAAILWVQRNADVLADSHGIGGNPGEGEVYGFASWTPRMGILALRNPTGRPAEFAVDLQQVFELPAAAAKHFVLRTPWKQGSPAAHSRGEAGKPLKFSLSPWEVLVLEAQPAP